MGQVANCHPQPWERAHPYDRLPFVVPSGNGTGRVMWAPRPTGDYHFDCFLGIEYAEAMLSLARAASAGDPLDVPQMLRSIVLDILAYGDDQRDQGVIVGMMGRLGEVLAAGIGRAE